MTTDISKVFTNIFDNLGDRKPFDVKEAVKLNAARDIPDFVVSLEMKGRDGNPYLMLPDLDVWATYDAVELPETRDDPAEPAGWQIDRVEFCGTDIMEALEQYDGAMGQVYAEIEKQ